MQRRFVRLIALLLAGIFLAGCNPVPAESDAVSIGYYQDAHSSGTTTVSTTVDTTTVTTESATTTTTVAPTTESTTTTTTATTTTTTVATTTTTVTKATTTRTTVTTTEEEPPVGNTVYVTPTGKRYHLIATCGGKNSTPTTLEKALARGLTPCKKCAQ